MSTRFAQKKAEKAKQDRAERRAMYKAQIKKMNEKGLTLPDPVKAQIKNSGGYGVEVLANAVESEVSKQIDATLPTSSSILQVTVQVSDRSISYLAMGIVLRAIRRGLMSAQVFRECPYYMFRYLIDAFTTAMQSGVSIITEAPLWYWEIFHALKPKLAKFKTASIQYKWEIAASGQTNDLAFPLGAGADTYNIWWGTGAGVGDVDGFPILGSLPAYTSDLGLAAIATLWSFCSSMTTPLIPDPGAAVATFNDTSAFAINYPELGASFNSVGGFRSTIYSERHIDTPLMAKFAEYQPPTSNLWRGWHKAGLSAGSASMIGPALIDVGAKKNLARNKIAPTVKVYNFDEIFEQLSLTMCVASEYLLAAGQTVAPCPLTSQQTQILLRQAILNQFDNDMFQDLRYDSNDRVHLLPFVVGPNGAVTSTVDILLPTFITENIRCMKGISAKASKKFDNGILQWYSVLARPSPQEYAQLGNYTYGGGSLLYPTDVAEVPINIIEMSAPYNQSTVYLDASRVEIQVLKEFWNEWIGKFSGVLSPLVSVTAEKGVRALNCNILTNADQVQIIPISQPLPTTVAATSKRKSMEAPTSIGISMASKRHKVGATPVFGESYFPYIAENETTSVEAIKPAAWPILSKWILPVDLANDQIEDSSSQGVRAFQVEPFKVPRSSAGGIGGASGQASSRPDALTRHLTAAQIDCKAYNTLVNNEIIQDFLTVGAAGRGGFFTSMVASLVTPFSPQAASVISAVGNAIGV